MRKQAVWLIYLCFGSPFNTWVATMNTQREKIFNVFLNQLMSLHSMVTITIAITIKSK